MPKATSVFACQQCGYQSPRFLGRCPDCGSWNSLVEEIQKPKVKSQNAVVSASKPVRLADVPAAQTARIGTGIGELDRVLGGGLVPGMAVLLAGEPGIGKSTLLLALADKLDKVLYVAGEESAGQIKIRAQRLGIEGKGLEILETTEVDGISPQGDLVIVDSIQTLTTQDLSGAAGSVGQVRECASRLIGASKRVGVPLILVGHVTKDGTIAGPKVLEHAVDTVLTLEGDRYSALRIIRAAKNRFGPTDEVGVFEMSDSGLKEVGNFTGVAEIRSEVGSCLTVVMEGTRPILAEVQALTTATPVPNPRRVASGVDHNRLLTIVAILQKRLNLPLYKEDIYVAVSGGIKITEPAGDLAIALAILSSFRNQSPGKMAAFGELDLLGNVRRVSWLEKRIKQAKSLGIKTILNFETLPSITRFRF